MRSYLVAVVAVAACHHAPAPVAVANGGGPGAAPAAPWAGLFAGDRTLVYDVTTSSSYYDDQDPAADANGNVNSEATAAVTCHLAVATVGAYRTAAITCDDPDGDDATLGGPIFEQLVRTYVTDGTRLWRLEAGAGFDSAAELEGVLPAEPDLVRDQQPVEREQHDDADSEAYGGDFGSVHRVTAAGDGWCIEDASWGGDEGGTGGCVGPRGVTSVSWYFAGGSSQDAKAELRP